ncbi:hypothetical protein D3C77_754220 [compost metagenome]
MKIHEIVSITWSQRVGNHWGFQECIAAYIHALQAKEEGDEHYRCYVPDLDPEVIWMEDDKYEEGRKDDSSAISPI